jgi:MFS family permease
LPAIPMRQKLGKAHVSIGATFVVHAFVSGSWAPRVPTIKANLDLDESELGIALMGLAIGLLLGTRIAGRPVDRWGTRLPIRLGLPVLCLALVGPALARSVTELTGAFVVLGFASGVLDVAMNANAIAVERACRRPIMSGLHGVWSVGLLAGSAVGSGAAALGAGALLHFTAVAAALFTLTFVATLGLLSTAPEDSARSDVHRALSREALWSAPALLLGMIAFSSFADEGSAADWSAVYMHGTIGTSIGFAGIAFVAFSVGMIAARFATDSLSARFGPTLLVRGGGFLAAGGLIVTLVADDPATAVTGYLLFGVGLGPIVPITFSAAGNVDHHRAGGMLASVFMTGYVGSVIGPLIIGFMADRLGLRVALIFPVLLSVSVSLLAFSVAPAAAGDPS